MVNINIKDLLGNGEMAYDTLFTEGTFEWFKSDEDAFIYVRNNETGRCSRYNAEAQNGKRISADEFESKLANMLLRVAKQEAEHKIEVAVEDPTVSVEEFAKMVGAEVTEEALEPAVINQYGCVDCSKCNVQNCVHRDCMRRNPTSVGGLGLCPRLNVEPTEEPTAPEEPKAPKAKRVRKPKDIGHTSAAVEGVTLTAKQVDFIRHLPDTCFWEHGLDSAIWVDCLCDDIGGQFKGKPMTVGAMISTLCEKGLGTRCKQRVNGKKATSFELTENGKLVAAELGLN